VSVDDTTIEAEVRRHLGSLEHPYEIIPCDPALADTAQFCAAYGYPPEDSANTILVIGKSNPPTHVACVVLSHTRLDVNHAVKQKLGKRASFASAEDTRAVTGMLIGGVTVFGLPPGIPVWVDSRVMQRERVVLGGGSRSCKIVAPPSILLKLPDVEVVEGLATEPPPAPANTDTNLIDIDAFARVDLRAAEVLTAERVPGADTLLRLTVDIGEGQARQILAGIAQWYPPESLVGRRIVVVANLQPRKLRGLESRGMLLAASVGEEGRPVLATFVEEVPNGARLR
jgi:methionine--tRNA ligase beta chain